MSRGRPKKKAAPKKAKKKESKVHIPKSPIRDEKGAIKDMGYGMKKEVKDKKIVELDGWLFETFITPRGNRGYKKLRKAK